MAWINRHADLVPISPRLATTFPADVSCSLGFSFHNDHENVTHPMIENDDVWLLVDSRQEVRNVRDKFSLPSQLCQPAA